MNVIRGFLLVWRHSFGQALRGKRGFALIFLAAIPCGLTGLVLANMQGPSTSPPSSGIQVHDYNVLVLLMLYRFVLPFAGLFLGVAVLGDEIEGRTITYLYTRPLPRPVFYLGRLFGYIAAFGILAAVSSYISTAMVAGKVELTAAQVAGPVWIGVFGFAVYTAFLAALRTLTGKAIYIGFFLIALLEWILASLPASGLSKCSIWHHMAVLQAKLYAPGQLDQIQELLQGIGAEETSRGSITTLALIFAVSAIVGAVVVRVREVNVPAAIA